MIKFLIPPKLDDPDAAAKERQLFPSILIEQGSTTLLGIINTIVMGLVSTAALAGVGQINSLNNMIFMFFNSLSQGGTVIVAQSIGAKDPERAKRSYQQALVGGLVLSLAVTAVLFFGKDLILSTLFGGVDADVMAASSGYFSMTLFATPIWFIYYQTAGAMRGSGDTKTPMQCTILMNITNITCSLIFVVLLGWGSKGTGTALLFSVSAGTLWALFKMFKPTYHLCPPSFLKYKPDFEAIKTIYSVGLPVAAENLMFHGGRLLVQIFISTMGTSNISAYQIANSITQIFQMPLMAANMLIVTMIGQRAGAGGKSKVRAMSDYYNKKLFIWSIYTAIVSLTLTYPVAWIFTREHDVILIVVGMLVIYALFCPFYSPSFNMPNEFRGARDTKFSLVIGSLSMWLVRVVGAWFFGVYLGWQAYGVYLAMCLDWVVRADAFMWYYKKDKWLAKIVGD